MMWPKIRLFENQRYQAMPELRRVLDIKIYLFILVVICKKRKKNEVVVNNFKIYLVLKSRYSFHNESALAP